jgi:hypothetical protein
MYQLLSLTHYWNTKCKAFVSYHVGAFARQVLAQKRNKYYIFWVCVCSLCYPACKVHLFCIVLYCHPWPLWRHCIFPHNLINGTNFGKYLLKQNVCSEFLLSETFLILRRIQHNITINAHSPLCKTLTVLLRLQNILEFLDIFSTGFQISKCMNIHHVGEEFFQADRRNDGRIYRTDEANGVFSQSRDCV